MTTQHLFANYLSNYVLEAQAEETDNPEKANADNSLGALSIQQVREFRSEVQHH